MLSVYSFSAAGLAGDPWVISLGALAVALRFTPDPFRLGGVGAGEVRRPSGEDVVIPANDQLVAS
jgi:hypothetical protein